jgi:carbonic anhydrase/acetyltransferase-like protein (isoleucine patch superfamily)
MTGMPRMRTGRRFGPLVDVAADAAIHDTALIHGKVRLGAGVSVWPHVVIRAELHEVVVGEGANLQDFVMIHVGYETPTRIGRNCSITHHATIHGAEIGDDVLIGINATVMDGARIGAGSIVAGHAIVTEGAQFPENSIIAGAPAKLIRERDCREANRANAEWYRANAQAYARGVHRMEDW